MKKRLIVVHLGFSKTDKVTKNNLQSLKNSVLFVCLFGVLRRFQHCTGHIMTGSWKGRGNQYI